MINDLNKHRQRSNTALHTIEKRKEDATFRVSKKPSTEQEGFRTGGRQIPPGIEMFCWQGECNQVRATAYALWTLLTFPSLLLSW